MTLPDPRHSRTDYGYHSGPDIETDMLNDIVGGSLPRMPGASATEQATHDDLMREFHDFGFVMVCLRRAMRSLTVSDLVGKLKRR